MKNLKSLLFVVLSVIIISCNSDDDNTNPTDDDGGITNPFEGAIYAMTNGETTNTIVAYGRNIDGTLTLIGSTDSEGAGTGANNVVPGPGGMTLDPLASNYSLIMSPNNNFVFAVNAGSNEVSSFVVNDDFSLTHVSTIDSGGNDPVTLATLGNTIYVANVDGGTGTLNGFTFDVNGVLSETSNSERTLTGRPTAIRFTRNGQYLVVTEVNTNRLQVYAVNGDLLSDMPNTFEYESPADGRNVSNPFGLETISRNGDQYVSVGEARVFTVDGVAAPQTSSVSTFLVGTDGSLTSISSDIRTDNDGDDSVGPITSCWVVANNAQNLIVSVNSFSNNISSFDLAANGDTTLNTSEAFAQSGDFEDSGLTDLVIIGDQFAYQMFAAEGSIVTLGISGGSLNNEIDRDTDLITAGGNQGITGF